MISLQVSTGLKFITVFILQSFIGCGDGFTYDEKGQVISGPPMDSGQQSAMIDTISKVPLADTVRVMQPAPAKVVAKPLVIRDTAKINTKSVSPAEVVSFAETQLGVRYKYGSINPKIGFDCSGFITYVFNHFDIKVPRSSIDFTHIGKVVAATEAKKGDLILFTGTNPKIRVVGHMGIVYSTENGQLQFIHSSSGKANGVTISPLEGYYEGRFLSIRRIFPENY